MEETISELLQSRNWQYLGVLSRSSFGTVISVKDADRHIVVVKFSKAKNKLERKLWPNILHPNIIPLYETIETSSDNVIAFVMPQCKISLANHLQGSSMVRREDALKTVRKWLFQILCGLRYLHRMKIAHLDLKLDNILLTNKDSVVISDFTHISDAKFVTSEHFMGMPGYWKPPELLNCTSAELHVPQKLDIWCYGLVVLESITRCSLNRYLKQRYAISLPDILAFLDSVFYEERYLEDKLKKAYPLNAESETILCAELFKDFLKLFLQKNPMKRINAEEAITHIAF